ncbi:MAG: DinB family protein [Dehalococcoidia bacterium]
MEAGLFIDKIVSTVDRVFAAIDGLPPEAVEWRPAADANSLGVIGAHVLGNLEEVLLGVFLGQASARDREAEFSAEGETAEGLSGRWAALRVEIVAGAGGPGEGALDKEYKHPRRGTIAGAELLLVVARHMAEHQGHAELTRQLWEAERARKPRASS